MNDSLVRSCKELIDRDNLPGLQELFEQLKSPETDFYVDWQYLWIKV